MKIFFLTVILAFHISPLFAQIQWQKCLGGSNDEAANSIQQTFDGGYIVAGYSLSNDGDLTVNHGEGDYWVVKLMPSGNIQWQKSLGGSGDDDGSYIRQTFDSGYIVAGKSASDDGDVSGNHGSSDYWVVKLSPSGNIQWQKSPGGTANDFATSIRQTTDSGFIIVGLSNSSDGDVTTNHGNFDYWVVKIAATGAIQWQKTFGGSDYEVATSVRQTLDGGYIVAGYTPSNDGDVTGNHGGNDCWIVKLSSSGSIQWQKCYGGSDNDYAMAIEQTSDSGYIVAGGSNSTDGDVSGNHGSDDCWILKLSSTGSIQWQECLGGSGSDAAESIQQTFDGGYIVTGATYSNDDEVSGNHGANDFWVVKLSSSGILLWQKCLGGTGNEIAWAIQQTADGNYIVAGYTFSNDDDVTGYHRGQDEWVVKLNDITAVNNITINPVISILPNPTTDIVYIKGAVPANIQLYNLTGQLIKQANNADKISLSELPNGMYFIRLFSNQGELLYQDKIVKQ